MTIIRHQFLPISLTSTLGTQDFWWVLSTEFMVGSEVVSSLIKCQSQSWPVLLKLSGHVFSVFVSLFMGSLYQLEVLSRACFHYLLLWQQSLACIRLRSWEQVDFLPLPQWETAFTFIQQQGNFAWHQARGGIFFWPFLQWLTSFNFFERRTPFHACLSGACRHLLHICAAFNFLPRPFSFLLRLVETFAK